MWFRAFLMQKESQWPQNGFGGAHKLSSHLSTPMSQSAPDRISYLSSISSLSSSHSGLFAVPSIGEGCLFLGIFLLAIFQAATFFPMVCTSDSLLFQLFVQILTRSSLTILVKMEPPPTHTHNQQALPCPFPVALFSLGLITIKFYYISFIYFVGCL